MTGIATLHTEKTTDTHLPNGYIPLIHDEDYKLATYYRCATSTCPFLTRRVVSFQANKSLPGYRWFKFKEAFSADLVSYFLDLHGESIGCVLDPFAGSGTTLFACANRGIDADGIELLPIGNAIYNAHKVLQNFSEKDFKLLRRFAKKENWKSRANDALIELRITSGAYPADTKKDLQSYISAIKQAPGHIKPVMIFAALCVLESVSYTRKDGQFLRWDNRSGRKLKRYFHKGELPKFSEALALKIEDIIKDRHVGCDLFPISKQGSTRLFPGSCLDILPTIEDSRYDYVFTSPPYCNRYDYTRTYALELALLGIDEENLSLLRQKMLTCTVENRPKKQTNPIWPSVLEKLDANILLNLILKHLEHQKKIGQLNNNSIVRMVTGYFMEMACVIAECSRIIKPGGRFVMVNDNVRYCGVNISVDYILSSIAEEMGFEVEQILVSPQLKGNSSQQMELYGRSPLRKSVYIWRKHVN